MQLRYILLLCLLVIPLCGYVIGDNITVTVNNPEYWYKAGVSELLLKHYDKALEYLDASVGQNPKQAAAWYWRGVAQETTGDTAGASESYAKAKEIDPYINDPYRKKVGALADLSVTPVPTTRPKTQTTPESYLTSTNVNLTKTPDPTGADIVLHDISAVVAQGGSELQITTTISNDGKKPTTNFYLTYYLSKLPTGASDDMSVGYYLVTNLLPGNTKKIEGYVPLDRITAGNYYVIASADPKYQIREVSKDNNVAVTPYTVAIQPYSGSNYSKQGSPGQMVVTDIIGQDVMMTSRPDLVIDTLSGPAKAARGEEIHVNATLRNLGDGAAGVFRTLVYLSSDQQISADDTIIGRGDIVGLNPGQIREQSLSIPILNETAEGTYYLGMMIDSEYHIDEKDESNNYFVSPNPIQIAGMVSPVEQVKPETIIPEQAGTLSPEPTKTVETPEPVSTPVAMSSDLNVTAEPSVTPSPEETPIPDLVVADISSSTEGTPGGDLQLNTSIRNQGTGDAGSFNVSLFLTQNESVSLDDLKLGVGPVGSLPAGNQTDGSAVARIPADLKPGTYYYGIIIDPENIIKESDKSNNNAIQKTPVIIK